MADTEFEQRMAKIQEEHTRRIAEIELGQICQRESISTYINEFSKIAEILRWGDAPLIAFFYNGLKDDVKDILCMKDRPDTLSGLIEQATKIDNRIQERGHRRSGSRPWGK